MAIVPIDEQIRAVGREVGLRRNVYAKRVASGSMQQADADRETAAMEGVYSTLKALKEYAVAHDHSTRALTADPDAMSIVARTAIADLDIAWSKLWPSIKPTEGTHV